MKGTSDCGRGAFRVLEKTGIHMDNEHGKRNIALGDFRKMDGVYDCRPVYLEHIVLNIWTSWK